MRNPNPALLRCVVIILLSIPLTQCLSLTPLDVNESQGTEVLQKALKQGLSPNSVDKKGIPLLTQAAEDGDLAKVQLLLQAGADPNIRSSSKARPLFYGLIPRHSYLAMPLINAGAKIELLSDFERRLLICAGVAQEHALLKDAAILSALSKGVSNTPCTKQQGSEFIDISVFHLAVQNGFLLSELVKVAGFELNAPMASNHPTPLGFAVSENPAVVGQLIALGADPKYPSMGHSPMWHALASGNKEAIEALSKHHSKSLKLSKAERNSLTCELSSGNNPELFKRLIRQSPGPNRHCTEELTLLSKVLYAGNPNKQADMMLAAGVSLEQPNKKGDKPLSVLLKAGGNTEAVEWLLKSGASAKHVRPDDIPAHISSNAKMVGLLIKAGMSAEALLQIQVAKECVSFDGSKDALRQKFYTSSWKTLQDNAGNPSTDSAVLAGYRSCLTSRHQSLANVRPYYSIGDELPSPSINFFAIAKMYAVLGMSHLGSQDRRKQDPIEAQRLVNRSFESMVNAMHRVNEAKRSHLAKKKRELEKEIKEERDSQETSMLFTMGAALLGANYMSNVGATSSEIMQFTNETMRLMELSIAQSEQEIAQLERNIRSIENQSYQVGTKQIKPWQQNGIRIMVPRYGSWHPLGALESHWAFDHTSRIVRIVSQSPDGNSSCTAAVIGPGKLLTAQHCLYDHKTGRWGTRLVAQYEVVKAGDAGPRVSKDYFNQGWQVETSKGVYQDRNGQYYRNDWLILTSLASKDKLPNWLKRSIPMASAKQYSDFVRKAKSYRISMAGYGSHLNDGAYLTMDWGCEIAYDRGGVLKHLCNGFSGDSGSPVVVASGPLKGRIIAIHSHGQRFTKSQARINSGLKGAVPVSEVYRQQQQGYVRRFTLNQ